MTYTPTRTTANVRILTQREELMLEAMNTGFNTHVMNEKTVLSMINFIKNIDAHREQARVTEFLDNDFQIHQDIQEMGQRAKNRALMAGKFERDLLRV